MWWLAIGVLVGACLRAAFRYTIPSSVVRSLREFSWFVWLLVLLSVFVFALDEQIESSTIFSIEEIIFNHKVRCLIFGLLFGFLLYPVREAILENLRRLMAQLFGEGENSPWVLQAILGVVLLFSILSLVRPDLIQRIESFKAGELEARFAAVPSVSSSTLAAIRFGALDFFRQDALDGWVNFSAGYVRTKDQGGEGAQESCAVTDLKLEADADKPDDKGLPRRNVVAFYSSRGISEQESIDGHNSLEAARIQVACVLFRFYFEPLISLVKCTEADGSLENLRRNQSYITPAYKLRKFLLDQDGKSKPPEGRLASILRDLSGLATSTAADVRDIRGKDCLFPRNRGLPSGRRPAQISGDVSLIDSSFDKILASIAKDPLFDAIMIDPYVTNFAGDLIGFFASNEEEAEFLSIMAAKYPFDIQNIDPGMVSIYYQMANSKLRSNFYWPIDDILSDLGKANALNEAILSYAYKDRDGPEGKTSKKQYEDIILTYLNNKIDFETKYIEIFAEHILQGHPLSDEQRADLNAHFGELQSEINAVDGDIPISVPGIPTHIIANVERADWRNASIDSQQKFDAETLLALGAVLLTEANENSISSGCAAAHEYLLNAKENIPALVTSFMPDKNHEKEERSSLGLRSVYTSRLEAYLKQISERVRVSCTRSN